MTRGVPPEPFASADPFLSLVPGTLSLDLSSSTSINLDPLLQFMTWQQHITIQQPLSFFVPSSVSIRDRRVGLRNVSPSIGFTCLGQDSNHVFGECPAATRLLASSPPWFRRLQGPPLGVQGSSRLPNCTSSIRTTTSAKAPCLSLVLLALL